ncbi:DUF6053 domain-containing protein [Lysobacter enzymogenes]|uniref:DUF6053 domain-containing protein n=1 Tax=Lysobacter enzymogenes TaxID=69 RepID=UPI003D189B28
MGGPSGPTLSAQAAAIPTKRNRASRPGFWLLASRSSAGGLGGRPRRRQKPPPICANTVVLLPPS